MSTKLIKDFAGYTTFHGLGFIVLPGSSLRRRLLWMCLFTLFMSLMLYQVTDRVTYFHSRPVTVNYRTIYNSSLRFPAVTFCNQNYHKASSAAAMGLHDLLKKSYSHSESVNVSALNLPKENITMEEVMLRTAHKKEDFIHRCSFGGKICSHEDFNTTITDHGVCYTFNKYDRDDHVVSLPGIHHGLHLLLNVEEYEYLFRANGSAGIKMLLHEPGDIPLVDSLGHTLQAGEKVVASIKTVTTKNLPKPYGVCENKELQFVEKYTTSNCLTECRAKLAVDKCECRLPSMTGTNEFAEQCTLHQYFGCMKQVVEYFEKVDCDCPVPCRQMIHDPFFSYASIPGFALKELVNSEEHERLLRKLVEYGETMYRFFNYLPKIKYLDATDFWTKAKRVHILFRDSMRSSIAEYSEIKGEIKQIRGKLDETGNAMDDIFKIMLPFLTKTYIYSIENMFYPLAAKENKEVFYVITIAILTAAKRTINETKTMFENDELANTPSVKDDLETYLAATLDQLDVFIAMADEAYYNRSLNESSIVASSQLYQNFTDSLVATISTWKTHIKRIKGRSDHLLTEIEGIMSDINKKYIEITKLIYVRTKMQQKLDYLFDYRYFSFTKNIDVANAWISGETVGIYLRLLDFERHTDINETIKGIFYWIKTHQRRNYKVCAAVSELIHLTGNITGIQRCPVMEKKYAEIYYISQRLPRGKGSIKRLLNTVHTMIENSKKYMESIRMNNTFNRENFLEVNIFYQSLGYEAVDQQEAYNIFSLLCDIGGSMGLLIGGSVLSLFEILDLMIRQVYWKRKIYLEEMERRKKDDGPCDACD